MNGQADLLTVRYLGLQKNLCVTMQDSQVKRFSPDHFFQRCRRQLTFTQMAVNIWNGLPAERITASVVRAFKANLELLLKNLPRRSPEA